MAPALGGKGAVGEQAGEPEEAAGSADADLLCGVGAAVAGDDRLRSGETADSGRRILSSADAGGLRPGKPAAAGEPSGVGTQPACGS